MCVYASVGIGEDDFEETLAHGGAVDAFTERS